MHGPPCNRSPIRGRFNCFSSENVGTLLVQGNSTVTLNTINIGTKTLTPIGSATSTLYNGIGFRPQDGFIWGSDGGVANKIVQVDATGALTVLPLTGGITLSNSGDVNPVTGLYYNGGGGSTTLREIDVTASPNPALVRTLTLSQKIGFDMAFSPSSGNAYTVYQGQLYSFAIPPSGTAVSVNGPILTTGVTLPAGDTYGAAFFDQNGIFYPYDNKGTLYRIDLNTSPATVSIAASGLPSVNNNDGAWCAAAPDMTKNANPRAIVPGGTTTYTFTINNILAATNVTFNDTLPTGLTFVPGTISPATIAGGTPVLSGGNATLTIPGMALVGATTYTFTIQAQAAVTANGNYANQASLTGTIYGGNAQISAISGDPTLLAPYQPTVVSVAVPSLGVAKTSNGPWTAGQAGATFTLTITNAGTGATSGTITVLDTLPAGISATSGTYSGWTCAVAGQSVTCTSSASLAATSGTSSITLPVTVAAAAAGSITNVASVGGGGDPNNGGTAPAPGSCVGGDPHCASTTTAVNLPQLTVTKSATPAVFAVGGTGAYSLTAGNAGTTSTSGAITITDALPGGITTTAMPSGSGWDCSASTPTKVSCTTAAVLAAGSSAPVISVPVAIAVGTVSPVVNTAAGSGGGDTTCPGSAHCFDQISTAVNVPQLQVTKTANGPWTVNQAGAQYTLTVTNAGMAATVGLVTVDDTLPGGITANWADPLTSNGWSCTGGGAQNVTCTAAPSLATGATSAIVLPVNVTAAAVPSGASASVTNNASVGGGGDPFDGGSTPAPGSGCASLDPASPGHCASASTTVGALADLAVTKVDNVGGSSIAPTTGNAVPGMSITYTVVASNAGPNTVTGATIADAMPAAIASDSWTAAGSGGATGFAASGTGSINDTVTMPVGSSVTYTVTATIRSGATGTLSNTATIAVPAGVTDPNAANNSATDSDTLTPSADLQAAITLPATAAAGSTVSGTFACTNNGPSDAANATCTVSGLPLGATVNCTPSPPVASLAGGSAIACTIGFTAPPGGSVAATATAGSATPDPAPGNNTATATVNVAPLANVSITKTANPASTYLPGQSLSYTIIVTNAGPSTVVGAAVSDTMPAGLASDTWTCAGLGGATCAASGSGNINDTVSIPGGGSVTYTVSGTAALSATGPITNTATVTSPVASSTCATAPCPSSASVTNTNGGAAQLNVAKSATPGAFAVGQTGTYSIVVSNAGTTSTAGSITVTDAMPGGITTTATPTGSGWDCSASTATNASCTTSAVLLPGGNAPVINVPVTVAVSAPSPAVNTASVAGGGDTTCPAAGHCSSTISTPVNAALINVTKSLSGSLVVGVPSHYLITATNNGQAATLAGTITDTIPTGLAIGTLPGGCASTGGQGIGCTLTAGIATGGSVSYAIPVTPQASVDGTNVGNTATVNSGGDPTCPAAGHCSGTTTNTVTAPQLLLTKSATPTTFVVNQAATYTLTLTNNGTAATTAATTIDDTIPGGLTVGTLPSACVSTGGQGIACTVAAPLATGSPVSFVIPVTATVSLNGMSVTNTAGATGGGDPGCPTGTAIGSLPARCVGSLTTPVEAPQLTLTKTASGPLAVGVPASYTLHVQNTGTAPTSGAITITDVIPGSLTIGALPVGCGATGQQVTCTTSTSLTTGGAGSTVSYVIPVTPMAAASPSVSNIASVQGGGDPTCPTTGNCTSTITTAVNTSANLTLVKIAPGTVPASGALTYTIGLGNSGQTASGTTATVEDVLPANVVATSVAAGTGVTSVDCGTMPSTAGATLTCTVDLDAALAAGAANGAAAFTIDTTAPAASGNITNDASVDPTGGTSPPTPGVTCMPATSCGSATTTVLAVLTGPGVAKAFAPATMAPNATSTLTITLANANVTAITGAAFTDTLPVGVTTQAGTAATTCAGGTPAQAAGSVSVSGATVPANGSCAVTVTVTAATAGSYTNTIPVGAVTTANAGSNASAATAALMVGSASLSLAKTSNGPWTVGQTSPPPVYTITATNTGAVPTSGTVTVDDALPSGVAAPASFTSAPWTCTTTGQNVVCSMPGTLAAGGSSAITIPVTIAAAAAGVITNHASAGGGGDSNNGGLPPVPGSCADGDPHCASAQTSVGSPNLTISKTGPDSVDSGSNVTYAIVVSNTGSVAATGITVTDPTPTGLTFVSATAPCSTGFPCSLGTLNAAASATISATYATAATATGTITNTASVSSDQTPPVSSSASIVTGPKPIPTPIDSRWMVLALIAILSATGAIGLRRRRG